MPGDDVMNARSDSPDQSRPAITVVGFGACMITGYPVDETAGFLRMAIARAQPEVDAEIECSIATLTALSGASGGRTFGRERISPPSRHCGVAIRAVGYENCGSTGMA